MPVGVIVAILAIVGVLGFGGGGGTSREQVQREIAALLSGIPQHGPTLGSAKAPITLWVSADLECPTVRRFATAYLPSIVRTWVRDGTVRLEYRSLRTDTDDEHAFFEQEAAALAAGRQDKMWNYALTFIHEQGQNHTGYASDEFLVDVASQVPDLGLDRWEHDRQDPPLFKRIARELHSAQIKELRYTPSFSLGFGGRQQSTVADSVSEEFKSSFIRTVSALADEAAEEASGDVPTLGFAGA
jgi:thioredoxin family protein